MHQLQRPTKRQRLKRALACQRLGLETPDSALLEVERGAPSGYPEAQGTALIALASQCCAALRHASFQSLAVGHVSLGHRSWPHDMQIVEQSLC